MVSGLGLEPRMTGPKPVVIPFHHPEINRCTTVSVTVRKRRTEHLLLYINSGLGVKRNLEIYVESSYKKVYKKRFCPSRVFYLPTLLPVVCFSPKQIP